MKPKSRLGRGLSSLISVSEPTAPPDQVSVPEVARAERSVVSVDLSANAPAFAPPPKHAIVEIPLEQIVPNPHQPRRKMDESSLGELALSVKSTGLIQPIVVRQSGDRYELIAGERRWRAAKLAGLALVPALVRQADSFQQAQMALVENIQRENLNPIDRALAYKSLMTQLGLTQAELASRMGEDRSGIANYLRLLDLPAGVQAMVGDGQLSMGHAKVLAGISDPMEQERLANLVVNQSLSVRNLERQIQESAKPVKTRETSDPAAHYQDLEKSLAQQLGLRVQLRAAKRGRGKLILHYGSLDQFDQLLSRLGVRLEQI